MTDEVTPNPKQQHDFIVSALKILKFEEVGDMGVYRMGLKEKQTVVDLTAGESVYFNVNGNKVDEDDDEKTLEHLKQIITDAKTGILPTQSEPDIVISGITDTPPTDAVDENTTPPPDWQTIPQPISEPAQEFAPSVEGTGMLKLINQYVGNDVLQVFGETGSGKSKFGLETAREAIAAGKKVYYLDTERNLTDSDIVSLTGCEYKYTPVLDEIDKIVQHLPAVDVVILDSIGFPVLTSYARLSMKQKGDALLKLIAIFGDLKTWAYKHNGVAIVTNQPESEFNKEKGHILRPFGDKSQFAAKEIWKTKIESRSQKETNISITAFRSRSVGFGTKIAFMKISNDGVIVA